MLPFPDQEPIWVATPAGLQDTVSDLSQCHYLAVDTESNGLHAFQERVCLIQFSTGKKDYLVDPLALEDLSPLGAVFENPNIEKIFHAVDFDLICMRRDFGFSFCTIFDTMQAGRILGKTILGLTGMLQAEFGIELDKRYQRSNWGKRPLPEAQLNYARLDSYFLMPLRERMLSLLEEQHLEALAQEDFRRLCNISLHSSENGSQACWRVAGNQELTPQQAAILQELCFYRDQKAREKDVPVFKIFGDRTLLQVALKNPSSLDDFFSNQWTGALFDPTLWPGPFTGRPGRPPGAADHSPAAASPRPSFS